jgi:hypothetical protein
MGHPFLKVLQDRRLVPWQRNRKLLAIGHRSSESIWLRSLGRVRDLLLFLLEQRKGFIDSLSETTCCSRTATQVRRHHYLDLDTLAVRQNRVGRQFNLNSVITNAECRNAIEVNEGCGFGASRGYSNPRYFDHRVGAVGHDGPRRCWQWDTTNPAR